MHQHSQTRTSILKRAREGAPRQGAQPPAGNLVTNRSSIIK